MLTLDYTGEFISSNPSTLTGVVLDTKGLGVIAKQTKAGRWQYRDADTKQLIASGMEPATFAKRFWYRDDFTAHH